MISSILAALGLGSASSAAAAGATAAGTAAAGSSAAGLAGAAGAGAAGAGAAGAAGAGAGLGIGDLLTSLGTSLGTTGAAVGPTASGAALGGNSPLAGLAQAFGMGAGGAGPGAGAANTMANFALDPGGTLGQALGPKIGLSPEIGKEAGSFVGKEAKPKPGMPATQAPQGKGPGDLEAVGAPQKTQGPGFIAGPDGILQWSW